MSFNDYSSIAVKIRNLRERNGLSQEDFAQKLGVARPTISNWENGKVIPTSEQLILISKTFSVSVDSILGINVNVESWIVPDTSVLLKRPRLIEELVRKFDKVLVSEIVISELNHIKEKSNHKMRQQAWVAMAGLEEHLKKPGSKVEYILDESKRETNDDRIIYMASLQAREHPNAVVNVLSDDIYFSLQKKFAPNLKFISLSEYSSILYEDACLYDQVATQEFFSEIKAKRLDKAQKLLARGIDINKIDPNSGFTPLIQAIRNRDLQAIDFLLSLPGTDINKMDMSKYELPPISHAVQLNSIEIVKKLIAGGCDFDLGSNGKNAGNTPLMIACWSGFKEIAELLIKEGACLNQQDNNGYTPLMKACIRNHPEIVQLLIDGTDKDVRSREGKIAEDYAIKNERIKKLFRSENLAR
ncbi:MAG: ankyrin repeat domain-containing protein [Methanomassiliicoccales archaeon]|nr:MAG: ankyrin repeat domain-containing protein [Methanomassiliicoccales archaeon]